MEVFDDSLIINFFIKKSTFDEIFFNLLTTNNILSRFFMGSLFLQNPAQQCIIFDTGSDRGLLEELFALLNEQSINDTYSNRIMENRIEIFFALLIRKYGKTPLIHDQTQKENDHWDMIAYINENFRTVTLSKIARKFNFEISYCSRLIKACTGKNFTALLSEIRMRYAKKLLLDSSERIYDISYSLGFENQETFIRAFKKNCGVTPSQFRVSYKGL
jgi:YesN/AraC family two-component response regulator